MLSTSSLTSSPISNPTSPHLEDPFSENSTAFCKPPPDLFSPNASPLISRNRRRLIHLTNSAGGQLADLMINNTPRPPTGPDSINPAPGRTFSRSATMPITISHNNSSTVQTLSSREDESNEMEVDTLKITPHVYNNGERFSVPHIQSDNHVIKRIKAHTLVQMLDGGFSHVLDKILVFDCRFKYEYEGGHIKGAQCVLSDEDLKSTLFQEAQDADQRLALIFHCEFSQHRGPRMAECLRRHDRDTNGVSYPKLYYPEVYVLEGGYKEFYESYSNYCDPVGYVKMNDESFKTDLKWEKTKRKGMFRSSSQLLEKRGLSRSSQSFCEVPVLRQMTDFQRDMSRRSSPTEFIFESFAIPSKPLESQKKNSSASKINFLKKDVRSWSQRF